jgi:hypothetical protein
MAEDQDPAKGDEEIKAAQTDSGKQSNTKKSKRGRIIKWTAGIATAAVTAFVVAYFTAIGNHVAALSTKPGQPAQPGGQPVKIDLVTIQPGPGQSSVFPGSLVLSASQLAALNSLNESAPSFQQWFTSRGGVAVDNLFVELIVEGNRDGAVQIVGMQPVVSCHDPLTGALFYSPSAGADLNTQLMINLDSPLTPPRYLANVNGQVSGGSDFFRHFTVSLDHGEQFTFLINASTTKQYCQFTLDMTVLDGSKTATESVSDNGKPFAVTAIYNADDLNPGAFSRYQELYVGGVATTGLAGSGRNQFGDPLWLRANPVTYKQ